MRIVLSETYGVFWIGCRFWGILHVDKREWLSGAQGGGKVTGVSEVDRNAARMVLGGITRTSASLHSRMGLHNMDRRT